MSLLKLFSAVPHHILAFSSILVGLLGIGVLIAFHEFGHFFFAKIFNVKTPSFSIGFGPQLLSKKIGETNFSLSLFPLGGYVELAGHHEVGQGKQEEAQRKDKRSFANKPYWQKLFIMFGGILFNIAFAYLAFFLLFYAGLPKSKYLAPFNMTSTIEHIEKESPAAQAGIIPGDTILQINNVTVDPDNIQSLLGTIAHNAGKTVDLQVKHPDGKEEKVSLTLKSINRQGKEIGSLGGVQFTTQEVPGSSLISSIKKGILVTNLWIVATIKGFIQLFKSRDYTNIGGPLLIISESAKEGGQGWKNLLVFLAIISINLAILNLIPLPILDGGQIFFQTLEAITGREIPQKAREYIQIGSWVLIMSLILYASYKDVLRLFKFKS